MKTLVITIISLSLFALTGCDNDSDDSPAQSNTVPSPQGMSDPPVVEPDAALTVDALQVLEAKLKRWVQLWGA